LDHIVKNRALGVITGEVGAGKSTAVRALSARLDPIRFSDSAIAQIYSISRGIPRVINNLCTACLLDVMAQGGQMVDVANVQRVQLDFEQL
ncbi:MAG: AAA family ATPase, partial [Bacillota bacterium]